MARTPTLPLAHPEERFAVRNGYARWLIAGGAPGWTRTAVIRRRPDIGTGG